MNNDASRQSQPFIARRDQLDAVELAIQDKKRELVKLEQQRDVPVQEELRSLAIAAHEAHSRAANLEMQQVTHQALPPVFTAILNSEDSPASIVANLRHLAPWYEKDKTVEQPILPPETNLTTPLGRKRSGSVIRSTRNKIMCQQSSQWSEDHHGIDVPSPENQVSTPDAASSLRTGIVSKLYPEYSGSMAISDKFQPPSIGRPPWSSCPGSTSPFPTVIDLVNSD